MENVFERCARRFLHAEKLTSLNMSYPERSIRRLSHVKSTWAFFCNEMVEVGGDSGCSFLHCRSVRKIAKWWIWLVFFFATCSISGEFFLMCGLAAERADNPLIFSPTLSRDKPTLLVIPTILHVFLSLCTCRVYNLKVRPWTGITPINTSWEPSKLMWLIKCYPRFILA